MNKDFNIAYEVSPILAASGIFGDKSGVYRYSYCLIKYMSEYLNSIGSDSKIFLYTLNPYLNFNPNIDFYSLLKNKNVIWLNIYVPVEKDSFSQNIVDFPGFRFIFKKINSFISKYKQKKFFSKYLNSLLNEFIRNNVKIIHHSETGFSYFPNIKNVITINDLIALKFPFLQRDETVEIHKRKVRFSVNYCDSIITISNNTKNDLIKYVGSDKLKNKKINTIYLGAENLSSDQEIPKINYLNTLLSSVGYGDIIREKYFLYFGTIEPRKNVPILIKAFLELKKINEFNEHKLVIIGGKGWGNAYDSVSNFIKETYPIKKDSQIIHLDFISDKILSGFIENAKAVVFPSSYEGFGLPIVESLRYETPCIVPNNSVFPELFEKDKNVSIYDSFEDLVSKMMNVKKFIKSETKFSWQKNAKETYELYKNTILQK